MSPAAEAERAAAVPDPGQEARQGARQEARQEARQAARAEARADSRPPEGLIGRLRASLRLRPAPSLREDIAEAIEEEEAEEAFSPEERRMLRNVLALRSLRVADVMVPRADVFAVPVTASLADLLRLFRTAGHSRLPVHGDTLDDPRGMVHIRDVLAHLLEAAGDPEGVAALEGHGNALTDAPPPDLSRLDLSRSIADSNVLRPVLYTPASTPAIDLLGRMRATRTHMALVIDEYGGTDGLVSMEDVVEAVVGDIEDEHDEADGPMVEALSDGAFLASARAPLEEVSAALGIDLAEEDVDTLGGYVAALAGRVPARGELVPGPRGLEFEVLDADARRVKRLRVHRRPPSAAGADAA